MMNLDELRSRMREKSAADLNAMFHHAEDWSPEALNAARAELIRRGMLPPRETCAPVAKEIRGSRSLNGFGTCFYGKRDFQRDGSFITTEWIIAAFLPLIPIRSLRIKSSGASERGFFLGFGSSESFAVIHTGPLNWKQVVHTYGYVAFLLIWTILAERFSSVPNSLLEALPLAIAWMLPLPLPWILRKHAKKHAHAA
jgi:hypothetical protein